MSELGICFIDFETSGIDVFRDEPFEFGAVLIDGKFNQVSTFNSRIKPAKKIHLRTSAFNTHQISLLDLESAPSPKQVLTRFFEEFGSDYRLAGWNISFDVTFLRKLCNKNGFMVPYNKINHRHLDIQTLNYSANQLNLLPDKTNSLSDLIKYFGLKRAEKHNALEDALLTCEVYKKLLSLYRSRINSLPGVSI